jgi:hypothetical protein
MKLLSLVGASGLLLCGLSVARADTTTTTVEPSGAVTTPSGAETTLPPPATVDTGTPATAPPVAPAQTVPAVPNPPASTTQDMALPAPPNGQITAPVPEPITEAPPPPVAVQPLPPEPEAYPGHVGIATHIGVAMLLGGGFQDFTNSRLRDMTGSGGYWDVRVVGGTREFVGFEAAYVGAARGMTALGYSSDARLISNGLEGDLRVNVPIVRGYSLVEPFGFVGVGWQHYMVTGNNNPITSDLQSKDDVLTLPFGGGLEFSYRNFMADARFTYRETYYNNLTSTVGGNLNNWNVGGQIGFEY